MGSPVSGSLDALETDAAGDKPRPVAEEPILPKRRDAADLDVGAEPAAGPLEGDVVEPRGHRLERGGAYDRRPQTRPVDERRRAAAAQLDRTADELAEPLARRPAFGREVEAGSLARVGGEFDHLPLAVELDGDLVDVRDPLAVEHPLGVAVARTVRVDERVLAVPLDRPGVGYFDRLDVDRVEALERVHPEVFDVGHHSAVRRAD